jgi:CHAT domain-containing protein/tetratricopeptide (TPR) repeat protein
MNPSLGDYSYAYSGTDRYAPRFRDLLAGFVVSAGLVVALTSARAETHAADLNDQTTANQNSEDPKNARELKLGKSVDREMAGDAVHFYRVTLESSQYMRVIVNQRGIDVVVSLIGPDGTKITESNSDNGNFGLEPASLVASAPGQYLVEVRSAEKKAPLGKYDIRLDQLRASNPQDKDRVAAEKLFLEGDHLRAPGKSEGIRQAMVKYDQALALLEKASDPLIEGQVLHGLGRLHTVLGDKPKALEYYLKALPARRASGDRRGEATTLNSIGTVYISLGELQKAVDYFKLALPIRREVGDLRGEAITINNIGVIYNDLGQTERAIEYLLKALNLRRQVGDREGEATTLQNLAKDYVKLGDRKTGAEYYKQMLAIRESLEQIRNNSTTLELKGDYYELLGENEKALDYYKQSLALVRALPDILAEQGLERKIGALVQTAGDLDGALVHYKRALDLVRTIESKTGEWSVMTLIARVERDRGNLDEALKAAETAIDRAETIRSAIETDDLRASYFATAQRLYGFTVDLLMQMDKRDSTKGYAAAALQLSERARARILLESLAEAKANIRLGADQSLLERQRATEQQLNDQAAKLRRLVLGKHTEEQVNDAKKQIEALRSAYQEIVAQIRVTSPRYAALVHPQALSLSDIQQQVLDDNTLLLEYALGEQHSYLWAVTPSALVSYELPARTEIEVAARRVYESLTARNKVVKFETPEEKHARIMKADAEFFGAATDLGRMVLGPVASALGKKRLLIVGDGALQYIPFAALSVPQQNSARDQRQSSLTAYRPLVSEHEVVSLPSASTLAVLRSEVSGRAPAAKAVAVLADPVFDPNDPRLSTANKSGKGNATQNGDSASSRTIATAVESDVTRSMSETDSEGEAPQYIPRLPFTRREADAITGLVPSANREEALDFAANRSTALSPDLGQYRFVHFATHGFLNSKHPELSGIVLSLVDEQGREQDGFLRAHEIYNLKLPADLVVLSGCRTGLGKDIRGEGLLSLTRGFMYAGAARVVVSLWDVNDEATAELMARFYKLMLGKKPLSPAAALKEAQASMSKDKRWQAPYYWAGFVLQGEPK